MGKKKVVPAPPVPDTTFTEYCGCCNKKFSQALRKSRKFVVNLVDAEKEVGIVPPPDAEPTENKNKIVDVNNGIEEILTWRYKSSFTGTIDPKFGLCPTCGLIVAKLYSALKLFESAKVESCFLNTVVQKHLQKDDKATDTEQDVIDEATAAAELEAASYLEEYYPEPDEEAEVARASRTREIDNSTKEFPCQFCSAGFDKNANLTRHLLLTHEVGDREKEFECGICGKSYYFSYLLKNHELIHGDKRPFVCKVPNCKASFKNKLGLHNHMKFFHRKSRPFKCQYCPKTFKDSRNHRNHEHYVHSLPTGAKPYACEHCGEHFKRASSLPGHYRKKCRKIGERIFNEQIVVVEEESDVVVETITIVDDEPHSILGSQMEVEDEVTLGLINH